MFVTQPRSRGASFANSISTKFIGSVALALIAVLTVAGCSKPEQHAADLNTADSLAFRPLSDSDALSDFDALVASVRSLYGPYEYKERRFGYNLEAEAQKVRAKFSSAKTDEERFALNLEYLRKLEDGHVSLSPLFRERKVIPIIIMPVEDRFIVAHVDSSVVPYGLNVGDEILSVDGITPEEGLKTILKYTWFANEESDRHLVFYFFYRPSHITELFPKKSFAQIEFAKQDGTKKIARIAWKQTSSRERTETIARAQAESQIVTDKSDTSEIHDAFTTKITAQPAPQQPPRLSIEEKVLGAKAMLSETLAERMEAVANIAEMGNTPPWYWNQKLRQTYQATMVTPEPDRVQRYYTLWNRQLDAFFPSVGPDARIPAVLPTVWAALYKFNGKTILLFRQPGYSVSDFPLHLAIYSALIEQFQPLADALVVDQTHNPGGIATYAESFAQLFAPNGMRGFVQRLNTDRKWYSALVSYWVSLTPVVAASPTGARIRAQALDLESDSEAGLRLTKEPFSFSLRDYLPPAPGNGVWKKPFIVLVDELCGSGGDAFPMAIRDNKLGKIFGNRTAGLGGSVEQVLQLPHSRASLALTRGLFSSFDPDNNYPDDQMVENNGVVPDVIYKHTVKDFRNGFDDYFRAFSQEVLKGIPPPPLPGAPISPFEKSNLLKATLSITGEPEQASFSF
ncbi:MAG: S41 family peptidase [Bdellovibrionales bacterium]|jgi:hypothetical protein|nr:S41 family peptidase [Bdellovibrionales bacterium]